VNEEALARWGLLCQKKEKEDNIKVRIYKINGKFYMNLFSGTSCSTGIT